MAGKGFTVKVIISYQNGETIMISIASLEGLVFACDCLQVSHMDGTQTNIDYCKIRSIVIA